jgi:ketosteroid isomerase-like protein
MKKSIFAVFFLILFASSIYSQDVEDVKSRIEKQNRIFTQAMLANDMEKMLSMYTDDVISMPSYQPTVKGIAKVRELSEQQMNSGWKTTHFVLTTTDIIFADNLAIEIGNYDMKMSGPNVSEWPDNGKYITIWEIQKDGTPKIKVETWNTDNNPWQEMQQNNQEELKKVE